MAGDWLKLHRKFEDSAAADDDWLCRLWVRCLIRANWKTGWFMGQEIPPGSFAIGTASFADKLHVSRAKLRRGFDKLQKLGQIVVKANNHFTTVTICNWQTYQNDDDQERPTSGQPAANQRPTSGQPAATIEERQEFNKKGRTEEGLLLLSEKLKAVVPARYATADVIEALGRWEEVYPSRNKGNRLNAITLQAQLKQSTLAGWDAAKLVRAIDLSIAKNAPYLYDPDHTPGGNGTGAKKKTALEEYGECPLPD